jgi:hypothetical protein
MLELSKELALLLRFLLRLGVTVKILISGMTTMAALLTSAIGALHATPLPSEWAFVYSSLVRDPTE